VGDELAHPTEKDDLYVNWCQSIVRDAVCANQLAIAFAIRMLADALFMESTILWRLTDGPPLRELMGTRPPHRGDLRGSLRSLGTVRTLVCGPSRGGLRKGRRPIRRRPCPCRHLPNRVDFAMMRGTSTPRAQPGAEGPPVKAIWGGEGSGWGEPQRGAAGLDSVAIWVPSWQAPRSCKRLVGMICVNSYCAPVSAAKCRSVGPREGPRVISMSMTPILS